MSTPNYHSPALPPTTPPTTTTTLEWPVSIATLPTEGNDDRVQEVELERLNATVRAVLRALNGCSHALTCAILMAIMGEFLSRTQGAWVAGLG